MKRVSEIFAAKVPRYTSYPTAPHFHAGIDAARYSQWLAALPADMPLSLYVHIPFCDTLCWFCGCHTTVINNYAPVANYCDLLLEEIAMVAAAMTMRHKVNHIHWGGGSPTLLNAGDIARLSATLREHFDLNPGAEFAIEIDPRGLSSATVDALGKAGLTRASIGLQDCNPDVQRAINRVQTNEETQHAVGLLRGAGVSSLNIDLVYGLPKQSLENWEATLDFALRLEPDRIAVFGYAHVPQFKKHQNLIPEHLLPGLDLRFQQAELAREKFCSHGYVAIGLDHYARPGDILAQAVAQKSVSRNFQGYTTDAAPALIGFGASAIGSLPQGYVQNLVHVPEYRRSIREGILPIARGIALSEDDRLYRSAIERLMCDMRVDLSAIAKQYRRPVAAFSDALDALAPLVQDGVVVLDGNSVIVPPHWRSAVRLVCAAFDQYLPRQPARHSLSV